MLRVRAFHSFDVPLADILYEAHRRLSGADIVFLMPKGGGLVLSELLQGPDPCCHLASRVTAANVIELA